MKKTRKYLSILLAVVMLLGAVPVMNTSAASFTPRLTAPDRTGYYGTQNSYNPFWTNSSAGNGNCTWYAWGRAYELLGSRPQLSTGNASTWYPQNKSNGTYSYGSSPRLGAIACWSGGSTGAGHVAVVEQVNSDGSFVISESSWSAKNWWFRTTTLNANGYHSSGLSFQGFIYIGDFSLSAPTYATIYTDDYSYAVDERVYFHMSSDGTFNNLWIYCPNGQTLTYMDVGTEYYLPFGMSGEYEALVQTWNDLGNYTSERIRFLVGAPTYAVLKTDKFSYKKDEKVTFTASCNGNYNNLWLYLPDGSSQVWKDIGQSKVITFGWIGHYQALVQTWNNSGNFISERIDFVIGPPTYANLSTNKSTYTVNEKVSFTCKCDGDLNTVWIYYPDGTSKYHWNIGNSVQDTFSQPGNYQALVQTWNESGNLISERISFTVESNHTHSYTNSTVTKPATCTATGIKTLTCSCGATKTETIAINPSNHVNTKNVAATASTCTVKGYTAGVYCNDCKKYISGHAEQPLAAHKTTLINAKEATYDAEGYTGDTYCTVCKQTLTKGTVISKLTKPDDPTNPTNPTNPTQPTNPAPQPQQSGGCAYCGQTHTGFPGILIGFFHSILALFGLRK